MQVSKAMTRQFHQLNREEGSRRVIVFSGIKSAFQYGVVFGESMRAGGRATSIFVTMLAVAACVNASGQATSPAIPAHKAAIVLFNGADLKNFDTFLKSNGLNSDPEHVFQVENGVIHVLGKEMGYFITKKTY